MSQKPKISDISWTRAAFSPVISCEGIPDPEDREPEDEGYSGVPCNWRPAMPHLFSKAELSRIAKNHALGHPEHRVIRLDMVQTVYMFREKE